ncbi:MAG: hypothetical protein ACT4P2_05800 [Pseudomonadota bacterium]
MRRHIARVPILGPALIDLARGLRDPETERAVRADYLKTVAEIAWLRSAMPEPPAAAKRLLIVSNTDMVYQMKLEAMLGAALKLEGWRPVVLTNSRTNTRAQRYFRAFGIGDFVYLDEFPPADAERERAAAEATRLLAGDMSFQAVKQWRFEGSWIGPQILATVSRQRHEGAPDPRQPGTHAEIAATLPGLLARVVVAERLVAAVRAELGLVIEANYATNGPVVDRLIADGAGVIQVVQPWRDDALTLKRLTAETRRMHPSSVSPATFKAVLRRPWTAREDDEVDRMFADRYSGKWFLQSRNQPGVRDAHRAAIGARLTLDPAKKTAVVFSPVLWDANLFFGEDLFEDYGDWFAETVRALAANPNLNWLVKLHPANLWKRAREGVEGEYSELGLIRARVGALPPHVKLLYPDSDISTRSLFEFADYGVTVRGTAGMELPCLGKPTLTAGTGRYSGLGFTVDSASAAEYLERLARLHLLAPMTEAERELARRHAHAAFVLRPWRMRSFKSAFLDHTERGGHPLDHNLVAVARSLDEARRNGDLERFSRWAQGGDVDYIEAAAADAS